MNIFSFAAHFGYNADCRNHFNEEQDKLCVVCKLCGYTHNI